MAEERKTAEHLVDLVLARNERTPNFALFLGAGASVTSGVKPASEMVAEWRLQLHAQTAAARPYEDWLHEQNWYRSDQEYPVLFEKVCDMPAQRRIYVENCVKDARPSWGYMYLASLLANKYFDVVFTTNFDDLANEACITYSGEKPMVCAHDSAVANVRVTSARPKIIKLHGDFLFDNIKNTVRETESLEANMQDKLEQFAREYGLIVVGYGGNDKSVMKVLRRLAREEAYVPHGIYWCVQKGARLSKKARELLRLQGVHCVEIEGFCELMAQMHRQSNLDLPDVVKDPYQATTERLNAFITGVGGKGEATSIRNPVILEDLNRLQQTIKDFETTVSPDQEAGIDKLVPYAFLGQGAFRRNEYTDAIAYFKKADVLGQLKLADLDRLALSYTYTDDFTSAGAIVARMMAINPRDSLVHLRQSRLETYEGEQHKALASLETALEHADDDETRATILTSVSNVRLLLEDYEGARATATEALQLSDDESSAPRINEAIALKRLDAGEEATEVFREVLAEETDHYFRAAAHAGLAEKGPMLAELSSAIGEDIMYRSHARIDPDFQEYRDDPDFIRLLAEHAPGSKE